MAKYYSFISIFICLLISSTGYSEPQASPQNKSVASRHCDLSNSDCTRQVGDPCNKDNDYCSRDLGEDAICIAPNAPKLDAGICSQTCEKDFTCPSGSTCVVRKIQKGNEFVGIALCMPTCNQDNDCTKGFLCYTDVYNNPKDNSEKNICLPSPYLKEKMSLSLQSTLSSLYPQSNEDQENTRYFGAECESGFQCKVDRTVCKVRIDSSYPGYCTGFCNRDSDCDERATYTFNGVEKQYFTNVKCVNTICKITCKHDVDCKDVGQKGSGLYVCQQGLCVRGEKAMFDTKIFCNDQTDCDDYQQCISNTCHIPIKIQ